MGKSLIKIIITIVLVLIIAGIIAALIYIAPKTEIVIYPTIEKDAFLSTVSISKIQGDLVNITIDEAVSYLQKIGNVENVDINNYYNIFDKTAYLRTRIFIRIGEKTLD